MDKDRVVWEGETPELHMAFSRAVTMRLYPFASRKQMEWCSTFLTVAPPPGHLEPCDFEESMESAA